MEQSPFEGSDSLSQQAAETERPREQWFHFGPWVFNISKAQAIIAESPRDTVPIKVEPWARFYGLDAREGESFSLFGPRNLDRDYAMRTDLGQPVVMGLLRTGEGEEFPLVIDGTHRLYHAYTEGVTQLPAYVLSVEETSAIREDGYIGGVDSRRRK